MMTPAILFLGQFFLLTAIGLGQSPCPKYFKYIHNTTTHEIMGHIEIPSPPKYVDLHLQVILSLPTKLPTNYAGRIELGQSKRESIQAVQQGRPLIYNVYFPLQNLIPFVTRVQLNNQIYCLGRRAVGPRVTSINLEHTLFPPKMILSDYPLPLSFTLAPTQNTDLDSAGNQASSSFNDECGLIGTDTVNKHVARKDMTPDKWPWLVAIFNTRNNETEFRCIGSLISNKHVITAAHCFKLIGEGIEVPPDALRVTFGCCDSPNKKVDASSNRDVSQIKLHPDYDQHNFHSDLAVIVLSRTVEYSPSIRPVCLWSGRVELDGVVGQTGYVVGRRHKKRGNSDLVFEARVFEAPIVSQEDCLRSHVSFVAATTKRTFCAGARDGNGPCKGDSGSGLLLVNNETGRYTLRGIASLSLFDVETHSCDLSQYIVYTDAAKYLDWIREQIAT